ncbi:MAG: hypothetical protein KGL39_15825 [Patescibacteria group bacterium]|nr:hypothetical protein [Patescibacteria group bacterium]
MATLNLVRNKQSEDVLGGRHKAITYDITGGTSDYATANGGYKISARAIGFKAILGGIVLGGNAAAGKLLTKIDTSVNNTSPNFGVGLRFFYPTGGASAPASLGEPSATATPAVGATAVTSTSAQPAIPVTAVAGEGLEVADATNLTSITVRVMFIGVLG